MVDKLQKSKDTLAKKYELQAELSRMQRFHLQNIEQLNQDKAYKKEKRQTALAYGENVSKLTNALIRIDSKLEESEDALVGIKQRDTELDLEIKKLNQEIVWMELEVDKEKLWKVARKYNEKAGELAEIVRDFWDLYDRVDSYRYDKDGYRWSFSSGINCDDFYHGSLNKIAFLRIGNENPRSSCYSTEYLFELYSYRNYERRDRRKQEELAKQQKATVAESSEDVDETDEDEFEDEEYIEDEEYSEDEDYDEDEEFEDDSDAEDSEEI